MTRLLLITLLLSITLVLGEQIQWHHNGDKVYFVRRGEYVQVGYRDIVDGSALEQTLGAPQLPVYVEQVVLEPGMTVTSWQVSTVEQAKLSGSYKIWPRQAPWHQEQKGDFIQPRRDIYQQATLFPEQAVRFLGIAHFNGLTVAHFAVYPLQYWPAKGELVLNKRLVLTYQQGPEQAQTLQPFLEIDQQKARQLLSKNRLFKTQVANPDADQLSSGLIDRYVIVTRDSLRTALQPLADWKYQRGIPTVIRSLEWIRANFPDGVDDAEKIRNFLRWSYQKRGTKYVLLAGDTDLIPTRIIHTGGYSFAADYYFADLDGTWNDNHNDIFGEAEDHTGAYPELYVARIPTNTRGQIANFIEKLFKYEKLNSRSIHPPYPTEVLYIAGNLNRENDGWELISKNIDPEINPLFPRTTITQSRDIGSDPQVALRELNKNYGLIFSENHGAYFTLRPGDRGSNIFGYQLEMLDNPLPAVWYVASCYTNDILKRSFSENYILSRGGGVAYIGNSSYEYPYSGIYLQKEFFNSVFSRSAYQLAKAHFLSRFPYLGYLGWEGPTRIEVLSTIVLGDPEMPIWTQPPQALNLSFRIAEGKDQYLLQATVTDSAGLPLQAATVTLYAASDQFMVAYTSDQGEVELPLSRFSVDSLWLTAWSHNYIPFEQKIALPQTPIAFAIDSFYVREISGNNNGACEPGEVVELHVKITNKAASTIEAPAKVSLTGFTPYITLSDTLREINQPIAAGKQKWLDPFRITISTSFGGDTLARFVLGLQPAGAEKIEQQTLYLPVHRPQLMLAGFTSHSQYQGEQYQTTLRPRITNVGQGMATWTVALITVNDPQAMVEHGLINFGNIAPGDTVLAPEVCRIHHHRSPDSIRIRLSLNDASGNGRDYWFDLQPPQIAPQLAFKPAEGTAIELNWQPSSSVDVLGYHIYRKTTAESNFQRITHYPITNAGYFIDDQVQDGLEYAYFIQAVDSSGVVSATTTDTILAWPGVGYQQHFPLPVEARAIGAEINGVLTWDVNNDSLKEIIYTGGHGLLSVYTAAGQRLYSREDLGGTPTVPAIGNVYGDQQPEIVVASTVEGLAENGISIIDARNGQLLGRIDLEYQAPTSVVLKDVDHDGLDDIMVLTHGGNAPEEPRKSRFYLFRSTGEGWEKMPNWNEPYYELENNWYLGQPAAGELDNSGMVSVLIPAQNSKLFLFQPENGQEPVWIKQFTDSLKGNLMAPVTLADLDGNGQKEIIIGAVRADLLFVLQQDGSFLPGWEGGKHVEVTDPWGRSSPAVVGDVDLDGQLEVVYVGRQHVYLFNPNGTLEAGWPVPVNNGDSQYDNYIEKRSPYNSPVLADLNNDGHMEIIFVTCYGILHALDSKTGKDIVGFPINTGSDMVQGQSPMVDDLDRDGDLEILFIAHEGRLFVWDIPVKYGEQTHLFWNMPFGNAGHTGEMDTTLVSVISALPEEPSPVINNYYLAQNYPNPFNPQTTITFGLKRSAHVELEVYNILGQKVAHVLSQYMAAGKHAVTWRATNARGVALPSGVYFYRFTVKDGAKGAVLYSKVRRMVLLK